VNVDDDDYDNNNNNFTEAKFWRQQRRNSKYNSWQVKTKSVKTWENKYFARQKLTVNARSVHSIEKY